MDLSSMNEKKPKRKSKKNRNSHFFACFLMILSGKEHNSVFFNSKMWPWIYHLWMKRNRNARVKKIEIRIFSPVFRLFCPGKSTIPCFSVPKFDHEFIIYEWKETEMQELKKKTKFEFFRVVFDDFVWKKAQFWVFQFQNLTIPEGRHVALPSGPRHSVSVVNFAHSAI